MPLLVASGVLSACGGDKTPELQPAVTISQPTEHQVLHPSDDEDSSAIGLQFSVKAHVKNITSQAKASLLIDGTASIANAPTQTLTATNGAADVTFSKITFPMGSHSVTVSVIDPGSNNKRGSAVTDVTVLGNEPADAGPMDMDAGPPDAGPMDMDAGPPDAGPMDMDAGPPDAGPMDMDAGPPDAGPMDMDAGPPDAGPMDEDAGPPDAGPPDAGPVDAGTPVIVQITSPTPSGSGTVFVVAADHNKNVTNGVAGYIPDSDPVAPGGQITITANLTAPVAGAGTVTFAQGSNVIGIQTVGFDGVSATQVTATVTLNETLDDTVTVAASDSAGDVGVASFPVRVDVTLPPAATLVTTDPGTGVYTHVINERHADWNAVFVCPSDALGAPYSYELGFSTKLQLGTQAFDETTFDTSPLVTHLSDACAAPGVATVAPVTGVPPFNLYEYVPRIIDAVGNEQVYPVGPPATLDIEWTKETIAYPGTDVSNVNFGQGLAVGDINGDGADDIAIYAHGNNDPATVSIYYGGAFPIGPPQVLTGPVGVYGYGYNPSLGDISGDHKADLAMLLSHSAVAVYLGTSAGLPASQTFDITGGTDIWGTSIVADLNHDGLKDLVVWSTSTGGGGTVYVFYGRADWSSFGGTFADADVTITEPVSGAIVGGLARGVRSIPDIDGDGYNELVVGERGVNRALVFLGKSLDTVRTGNVNDFSPQVLSAPGGSGATLFGTDAAPVDFNGDGLIDIAIGEVDSASIVFAASQADGGLFQAPVAFVSASPQGSSYFGSALTSADLNGDGALDLIASTNGSGAAGSLWLYPSNPTGISAARYGAMFGGSGFGADAVVGDIDADGRLDLIVGEPSNGTGNVYVFH